MNMQAAIKAMSLGQNLSHDEMLAVMRIIMTGDATPAQIGAFLMGLRLKGETVDEIAAAASVMRELAEKVNVGGDHLVDTCGTGGDGANTFNISTTSAFVVAAAGGQVAKHGNRSVSSKSGSADVLEAAGVNLSLSADQVAQCVNEVGVGFMFAPMHHSAMKHAIGPRKEMGIRTMFNILGPLTNPAGAPNQVMGVFDKQWLRPVAEVLQKLGSQHVLVVHADDGLDEISLATATSVAELHNGEINEYSISPEDFGLSTQSIAPLAVGSVEQSLAMMRSVLGNQAGPALDIVLLNAGAAIYAADLVSDLRAGVEAAREAISSGKAAAKLGKLVEFSKSLSA